MVVRPKSPTQSITQSARFTEKEENLVFNNYRDMKLPLIIIKRDDLILGRESGPMPPIVLWLIK